MGIEPWAPTMGAPLIGHSATGRPAPSYSTRTNASPRVSLVIIAQRTPSEAVTNGFHLVLSSTPSLCEKASGASRRTPSTRSYTWTGRDDRGLAFASRHALNALL